MPSITRQATYAKDRVLERFLQCIGLEATSPRGVWQEMPAGYYIRVLMVTASVWKHPLLSVDGLSRKSYMRTVNHPGMSIFCYLCSLQIDKGPRCPSPLLRLTENNEDKY